MRSGQTMLEYVLAFTALLAAVAAMYAFSGAVRRSAARTERFVSQNFP